MTAEGVETLKIVVPAALTVAVSVAGTATASRLGCDDGAGWAYRQKPGKGPARCRLVVTPGRASRVKGWGRVRT